MQYIDAAMVGRLGADPAAAVGIVTTTTLAFSAAYAFLLRRAFPFRLPIRLVAVIFAPPARIACGFQMRPATQRRPLVGGLRH